MHRRGLRWQHDRPHAGLCFRAIAASPKCKAVPGQAAARRSRPHSRWPCGRQHLRPDFGWIDHRCPAGAAFCDCRCHGGPRWGFGRNAYDISGPRSEPACRDASVRRDRILPDRRLLDGSSQYGFAAVDFINHCLCPKLCAERVIAAEEKAALLLVGEPKPQITPQQRHWFSHCPITGTPVCRHEVPASCRREGACLLKLGSCACRSRGEPGQWCAWLWGLSHTRCLVLL